MRRLGTLAASLALLGAAGTGSMAEAAFKPPAIEATCAHSGPLQNVVTFATYDGEETLEIRRLGTEIRLYSEHIYGFRRKGKRGFRIKRVEVSPVCPVTPTVSNTDLIRVLVKAEEDIDLSISQHAGPLSPGATPEADESSEIEVEVEIGSPGQTVTFAGDASANRIRFGTTQAGLLGVNLNAEDEAAAPDIDATVALAQPQPDYVSEDEQKEWPFASAMGLGGGDTITTAGGPEFTGATPRVLVARGGGGSDTITSVGDRFNLLNGGPGDDLIDGGTKFNLIRAGRGDDVVLGGDGEDIVELGDGRDSADTFAGKDTVLAWDGFRDVVRCGLGRDLVTRDRKDRQPDCERKSDYRGGFRFD